MWIYSARTVVVDDAFRAIWPDVPETPEQGDHYYIGEWHGDGETRLLYGTYHDLVTVKSRPITQQNTRKPTPAEIETLTLGETHYTPAMHPLNALF